MLREIQALRPGNVIYKNIIYLLIIATVFITFKLQAQYDHTYPRTYLQNWGSSPAWWYARFDLVDTPKAGEDFATDIKNISPNTKIISTHDWNAGADMSSIPDSWYVRKSDGSYFEIYGGLCKLVDFTDYCPRSSGKRYNESLPDYIVKRSNLAWMDGIATDGIWGHPYEPKKPYDVDLDRNGVNDWDEHGKNWIKSKWREGLNKILAQIRQLIGEKALSLNSGTFHTWGWENSTGIMLEKSWGLYSWNWWKGMYNDWMNTAPEPHVFMVGGCASYRHANRPSKSKNSYQTMRFLLTSAMLGDAYFEYCDIESGEHYYNKYYDEFDVDVGFPTSKDIKLGNGVWIRFFDKGVSMVNATGSDKLVTDADLKQYSAYNGPYYRFSGGQDPDHNNGVQLDNITLFGDMDDANLSGKVIGDGIILLTEKKAVIADIILDDCDVGTSPGSDPPIFNGNWEHSYERKARNFSVTTQSYKDFFSYSVISAGSGGATATYKVNVGVTGQYTIYEWHGFHGSSEDAYQEASNVPCQIKHTGGTTSAIIDETRNYGKWNKLGVFKFTKGADEYIKISNNANGYVIADAFRLVYHAGPPDTIDPNEPRDLICENTTENSITLSWSAPYPASDGDVAASYRVHRNNNLVGTSISTSYTDTGLSENTAYNYSVYAVDDAGNISQSAATRSCSTPPDIAPPTINNARALGITSVEIEFSEAVEQVSAEETSNYAIDQNIVVHSAGLLNDHKTVQLTTSQHEKAKNYTIVINNIKDRASLPNEIAPNTNATYVSVGDSLKVIIAADNRYECYINGKLQGTGDDWANAQTYQVPLEQNDNVVAVKCDDEGGEAGLVVEVVYKGKHYSSNENYWKVSTVEEQDWEKVSFNDASWQSATSHGLYGDPQTLPWADYHDGLVQGISTDKAVHWIWSSDFVNHNCIYLRFTGKAAGQNRPNPPTGVTITKP